MIVNKDFDDIVIVVIIVLSNFQQSVSRKEKRKKKKLKLKNELKRYSFDTIIFLKHMIKLKRKIKCEIK